MPATRRPRKLPYDGVRNGWYATLPDPAPARVLSGDVSADWAVLGGGACGRSESRDGCMSDTYDHTLQRPAGGEDRGSLANAGMLGRSGSALGRVGSWKCCPT